MPGAESTIVLFPRFTTLIGASEGLNTFSSLPLDVSGFGSAQFQVWRGGIKGPSQEFTLYLEESLDGRTWVLGSSAPRPLEMQSAGTRFLSYAFRLRWFRLRVEFEGPDALVTCWAEGLLR